MSEAGPEKVVIPVVWVGTDETPVFSVNQFLVQVHEGEVFLTVGSLTPPVVLGETAAELRRAAEQLGYVPVRTVARFSLTRRRLLELRSLLDRGMEMYAAQPTVEEGDK